ncbi:MAG: phage holin family protein [Gaiellaceae bacterium]
MLVVLLVTWVVVAVAFGITSRLLPGMEVSGGFGSYLWVSALFGLVNALIGTILRRLTLSLSLLTLGLISLLVSAAVLAVTDALTDRLTIDDFFWTTIWAAMILAFVTVVLEAAALAVLRRLGK